MGKRRDDAVKDAETALEAFAGKDNLVDEDGRVDAVTDLLVNLMHYCEANGWDFDDLADQAHEHFETEEED